MVKVQAGEHNFYLDGYLKSNLDAVKHNVKRNDYDSFIVITGREGFGKSTLAAQIATYLDPTYNIDRCCFTAEQFQDACENAEKFQAVVFDETMGYLASRGAMSAFNRGLIKIMSEMRSKNLFVLLCIPNFFELDKYPALHRTTGLIHIPKRTRFGSYDYKAKKLLYLTGKKTYSYVTKPNFIGVFVKYFPLDKVKYEAKKQESIKQWQTQKTRSTEWKEQRDKAIKLLIDKTNLTQKEICAEIGMTESRVSRILKVAPKLS